MAAAPLSINVRNARPMLVAGWRARKIRKAPASVCYDRGLALTLSGSTGADVGGLQQRQNTYRTRRSSRPSRTQSLYWDRHADTDEE